MGEAVPLSTRDRAYILHVRDAIRQVLEYTRDGREFFRADRKTQDAVVRNIEIIGEATKNLSDALKAAHADIPWRRIAGMRDRLIHHYFSVDLDLVWKVVEEDLPALGRRIEAIIAAMPSAGPADPVTGKEPLAMTPSEPTRSLNFIEEIIEEHNRSGRFDGNVHTRFPPEPNGYLHVGHAKSICLNYGLAQKYGGKFNLRYDDTNPTKEEQEYVDSIREDVRWLGADWEGREFYASDYFDQLYDWAEKLIREGKAFVCDLTADEMAKYRGDLKGGQESPYRNRSVEENLDLFRHMKAGEFPEGRGPCGRRST